LFAGWIAFAGAIIGGGLTLGGVWLTLYRVKIAKKKENDQFLLGLYQALHAELNTLKYVYENGDWGKFIENLQPEKFIDSYFPMGHEYFTIYKNNASLIGQIPDGKLRQKIIEAYVIMMGMLDSINYNNSLLQELEEKKKLPLAVDQTQLITRMKDYAVKIKQRHEHLKIIIPKL
jgi:hypothetical protein